MNTRLQKLWLKLSKHQRTKLLRSKLQRTRLLKNKPQRITQLMKRLLRIRDHHMELAVELQLHTESHTATIDQLLTTPLFIIDQQLELIMHPGIHHQCIIHLYILRLFIILLILLQQLTNQGTSLHINIIQLSIIRLFIIQEPIFQVFTIQELILQVCTTQLPMVIMKVHQKIRPLRNKLRKTRLSRKRLQKTSTIIQSLIILMPITQLPTIPNIPTTQMYTTHTIQLTWPINIMYTTANITMLHHRTTKLSRVINRNLAKKDHGDWHQTHQTVNALQMERKTNLSARKTQLVTPQPPACPMTNATGDPEKLPHALLRAHHSMWKTFRLSSKVLTNHLPAWPELKSTTPPPTPLLVLPESLSSLSDPSSCLRSGTKSHKPASSPNSETNI